ncbi:hypothetical protein GJ496_002763 [Pomphorhynchus laevis]|nr:hypothetical protein GJ496_002763 [Pomphorhynchus laevis]
MLTSYDELGIVVPSSLYEAEWKSASIMCTPLEPGMTGMELEQAQREISRCSKVDKKLKRHNEFVNVLCGCSDIDKQALLHVRCEGASTWLSTKLNEDSANQLTKYEFSDGICTR